MTNPYDGPGCEIPGCTRPQAPGWRLCASDGRHLGELLAKLGDRYAALTAAPSMAAPEPGSGHGGTLASQRDPARLHVLVLTDRRSKERDPAEPEPDDNDLLSVFEVLHAHAEAVREERQLAYPTITVPGVYAGDRPDGPACVDCRHPTCLHIRPGPAVTIPAPLTVATERRVLVHHLDWILGQEWAAEFHRDVTSLWTLLTGARTVGVCAACGGPVTYANRQASCACGTRTGLDLIEYTTGRTA